NYRVAEESPNGFIKDADVSVIWKDLVADRLKIRIRHRDRLLGVRLLHLHLFEFTAGRIDAVRDGYRTPVLFECIEAGTLCDDIGLRALGDKISQDGSLYRAVVDLKIEAPGKLCVIKNKVFLIDRADDGKRILVDQHLSTLDADDGKSHPYHAVLADP